MSLNKVNYVHGQTIISAQNMNDIQDEIIRLGEKEAVQSDWLEQDENSLAYIKNKPFGAAGKYTVIDVKEAAQSDNLIEVTMRDPSNNNNNAIYYLYKIDYNGWDFTGLGHDQKIAFEMNNGYYCTLYDMRCAFGAKQSLESYGFNNPNVSGVVQFWSDVSGSPNLGIVVIEDSTDSTITTGVYLCFNSNKQTVVSKVLMNSSCTWLGPGALSTIDMPLGVNYALAALEDIRTPLKPMIDSATESLNNLSDALDNKVDKVNGKGLSDVNFTKEYEDEVKYIDTLRTDIMDLRMNYSDQDEIMAMVNAAAARATEIITNPYGAYLNSQVLSNEISKINLGESSDKVFVQDGIFVIRLSEKVPSNEEMSKGATIVLSMVGVQEQSSADFLPSWTPSLIPYTYIHIGDIRFDDKGWDFVNSSTVVFDGGKKFLEGMVIVIEDSDNEYGLPVGIYTTLNMFQLPGLMCSGLQIDGFNLNSSTAPVSQEQLGDISSILDSIIGEQVWTFTLEDGSTVDKVVISSD